MKRVLGACTEAFSYRRSRSCRLSPSRWVRLPYEPFVSILRARALDIPPPIAPTRPYYALMSPARGLRVLQGAAAPRVAGDGPEAVGGVGRGHRGVPHLLPARHPQAPHHARRLARVRLPGRPRRQRRKRSRARGGPRGNVVLRLPDVRRRGAQGFLPRLPDQRVQVRPRYRAHLCEQRLPSSSFRALNESKPPREGLGGLICVCSQSWPREAG